MHCLLTEDGALGSPQQWKAVPKELRYSLEATQKENEFLDLLDHPCDSGSSPSGGFPEKSI